MGSGFVVKTSKRKSVQIPVAVVKLAVRIFETRLNTVRISQKDPSRKAIHLQPYVSCITIGLNPTTTQPTIEKIVISHLSRISSAEVDEFTYAQNLTFKIRIFEIKLIYSITSCNSTYTFFKYKVTLQGNSDIYFKCGKKSDLYLKIFASDS